MQPAAYDKIEKLRSGLAIRIRAIRPGDQAGLARAFKQLEAETVYTRFFQAKTALSAQELKEATEVDFDEVVALVVTLQAGAKETIIGGGRYFVIDPLATPRSAEVAFLVEEDYHGLGIGGRILRHLAAIAREAGVAAFEAEVLPQNKAMLAVFTRSGLAMKRVEADGSVHVTLTL